MINRWFVDSSLQDHVAAIKASNTQLDICKINAAGNVTAFAKQ